MLPYWILRKSPDTVPAPIWLTVYVQLHPDMLLCILCYAQHVTENQSELDMSFLLLGRLSVLVHPN